MLRFFHEQQPKLSEHSGQSTPLSETDSESRREHGVLNLDASVPESWNIHLRYAFKVKDSFYTGDSQPSGKRLLLTRNAGQTTRRNWSSYVWSPLIWSICARYVEEFSQLYKLPRAFQTSVQTVAAGSSFVFIALTNESD